MGNGSMDSDDLTEPRDRRRWIDFVAGWSAGYINVTMTYPMQKVLYRQMLQGIPTSKAVRQVRKEGIRMLYRGFLPPLIQKTVATSMMFGLYETYQQMIVSKCLHIDPRITKSFAAAFAGVNEAVVLAPLERIQTLLNDRNYNSKLHSTIHTVRHLRKHYGLREFYRGTSVIMWRNSVGNIIFFAAKEKTKKIVPQTNNFWTQILSDFISGGLLGAGRSTIVYPLNVVKARMQSRIGGPFESPRAVLRTIFNERGRKVSELYRGVHLNYTRSVLSWGITNASYELISLLMHKIIHDDS